MDNKRVGNIIIENANISPYHKNFAGREDNFNREGDRNFRLMIDDPEVAEKLLIDGWNVRSYETSDGVKKYYLKVSVSYKIRALSPKIVLVTSKNRNALDEETVECLDANTIIKADVVIRPRPWEINGKKGIKAYLKTLYATIEEDEFAYKYSDSLDDDTQF